MIRILDIPVSATLPLATAALVMFFSKRFEAVKRSEGDPLGLVSYFSLSSLGLFVVLVPLLALSLHEAPRDNWEFLAALSQRIDFSVVIALLVAVSSGGVLAMGLVARASTELQWKIFLRSRGSMFTSRKTERSFLRYLSLLVGVVGSLAVFAATNHRIELSRAEIRIGSFGFAAPKNLKIEEISRVVRFSRRQGLVGKPHAAEHLVLMLRTGEKFDTFSLVKGKGVDRLEQVLNRVLPDVPLDKNDVHRVFEE